MTPSSRYFPPPRREILNRSKADDEPLRQAIGGSVSALGRMVCSAKPGKRTGRISASLSDSSAERLWSIQSNIQHEQESANEKRSPAVPIGAGPTRAEA